MHTLRLIVLWALSVVWLQPALAGRCPNVGIILDRSASMAQTPDGTAPSPSNPTKWTIATKAVSDIVTRNDGKFPMGLVYFPSTSVMGVCGASASFDIPIGYGQQSAILSSLGTVMPSGNTPTGDAINYAINDQVFLDSARKQYLILITDGKPCCMPGCSDASILAFDAVNAVKLARGRKVEIQTFVIGFGKLAPDEQQVMNDMADAGGQPAAKTGMYRYYRAEDSTALNATLDGIIKTVISGGGDVGSGTTVCDDSCYSVPCPSGQICVSAQCQKNPCSGVSCPAGTYCYTNGTSAAECISPCRDACGSGQRCIRGVCQASSCADPCAKAEVCDGGSCRADAACAGISCKSGQGCVAGRCVDDPCAYLTCPRNFACVAMEGTCLPLPGTDPHADDPNQLAVSGCSCDLRHGHTGHSVLTSVASLAMVLFLLRRRRPTSS